MRPVLLSTIENKKFLLGTFDTTEFKSWWKSETFPGSIDHIGKPVHVYGQYHVCIVKKSDGTYSIYRTKDSGKSWIEVYNTAYIIHTLELIDYGWIIGSTSHGWIESRLDSGYTWSEISTFAPNCKTIINIDDDVLFAHDGRKIWRSTDFAHTWSKVLDSSSWTSIPYHTGGPSRNFSWNSESYPAIAGANQCILVGFGPYLIISEDVGKTWLTHINGWTGENWDYSSWGLDGQFGPQFNTRILQLVVTSIDGYTLSDISFMARTINNTGYVRYIYSGPSYIWTVGGTSWTSAFAWKNIFSLPFANYEQGEISAYDVLRPGSPTHDIFASICSYDSNNNAIVKYSTNGGYSWSTINNSNVSVYEGDPSQEIISGLGQQVFDEEYFTNSIWIGLPCHNDGYYLVEYNKAVRGISFDTDLLTLFRNTKTYPVDMVSYITYSESCNFDILNKKFFIESIESDMALKDTILLLYNCDICSKKEFLSELDMDITIAERSSSEFDIDLLVQKTCLLEMYPRMYLVGPNEKTFGMEMKIVDNHIDEIMNSIEKYTVQGPDIRYPDIPYKPVDFRTDKVTL